MTLFEIPHRGAHLVAGVERCQDAPAADEARSAGDQNAGGSHHRAIPGTRARMAFMVASSETPCQSYRGVYGAVSAMTSSSVSSTSSEAIASSICLVDPAPTSGAVT